MSKPMFPPRPIGPHPTADRLYRALAAERARADRAEPGALASEDEAVLEHVAACAECSAEIAHLEAFEHPTPMAPEDLDAAWRRFQEGPSAAPAPMPLETPRGATIVPFPSAVTRPAPTFRISRYAGWAAAAMLVVGLGLGYLLGTSNTLTPAPAAADLPPAPPAVPASPAPVPEDPLRGGEQPVTAEALAPTGALDRRPTEIRFSNPDHQPKRVLLFATEPPYQWQSPETTGERVEIPAAEQAKLRLGVDYFWSVLDAEGESAAQTFRLR